MQQQTEVCWHEQGNSEDITPEPYSRVGRIDTLYTHESASIDKVALVR